MPQPHLCLFDTLKDPPSEVAERIETILATTGLTFNGEVRKFERRKDGILYYAIDTLDAHTWTEGLAKAAAAKWPGLAFECRYRGYTVSVALLAEGGATTLALDHDSVLYYEIDKDPDLYRAWLAMLLEVVEAVGASICLFRRGGVKEPITTANVIDLARAAAAGQEWIAILLIARGEVLSYEAAVALGLARVKIFSTTSDLTVVSSMHWRD